MATTRGNMVKEVIPGMLSWQERRDFIMASIDKYGQILHNHYQRSGGKRQLYWWNEILVKEDDFSRLLDMGVIKRIKIGNSNYFTRAVPLVKETLEPRIPYKKRSEALKELQEVNEKRLKRKNRDTNKRIHTTKGVGQKI